VTRILASCLTGWLLVSTAAAEDSPAILQIRVLEGEGAIYAPGSRATRGVTVQITDETGKPVEGASVSFRLPETGPGGAFSNGLKSEFATTKADGRALVWGMQWNRLTGPFEIRITASKGQARAGGVCPQYLSEAVTTKGTSLARVGGGSHKWLWISLAVAGAAGGAVAAAAMGGKPASTTSPAVIEIGTPSINLGKP